MVGGGIGLAITGWYLLAGGVLLAVSAADQSTDANEDRKVGVGLTAFGLVGSAVTGGLLFYGYRENQAARRGELRVMADPRARLVGLGWGRRF